MAAVRPYLESSEFDPEFIRSKSFAAAGLCAWVINIVKFYEVFCDVEPKRKALAAANAELKAAQERLAKIKAKIKVGLEAICGKKESFHIIIYKLYHHRCSVMG